MHRIPQAFSVNWNGLPPHLEHTRAPVITQMITDAPRKRDEYIARKEMKHA